MQHEICYLTFNNKLRYAPPYDEGAKVGRVLDLGTGPGLWAIDSADQHPEAEVLGVDLSPIQPRDVPTNLKFEVDDVEEDWIYSRPFEYIHLRMLDGSIANWRRLLTKIYDNLPLARFGTLIREAAEKFGQPFIPVVGLRDLMVDVGFKDVALQSFKWPSNPWPQDPHHKRIGEWNFHNFFEAAEGLAMASLTRAHKWTSEKVQVFLVGVRKDMRDRNVHSHFPT
ncbi:methyltransferase domain-containing protein [Colletotrichum incanum]|nr:methyltransferase domain-containing protein [Colletotrichum incanum]